MDKSLWVFLLSAAGISLSGVMLPGPLTAATIAKGYDDKNAGALITAGHAVIEIPLIIAIYFGFGEFFKFSQLVKSMYILGGLVLLYLGFRMFRAGGEAVSQKSGLPASTLVTGIVITGTNPAFYLWWATVGVVLVATAANFGILGMSLFVLVHLPCDLAWSQFLSLGTFGSRRWWTKRVQKIVFSVCALVLAGFGAWFCLSAFINGLRT